MKLLLGGPASEVTVGFVGTMANEYVDSGIPFLRSLNVGRLKIDTYDIRYISQDFHSRISKSRLRPGDVVIVRTGKPGTCAVIPEELPDSNCSDLVIVRCGAEILNRFLCYYVNSAASNHIAAHTVGAVQQHFNVASAKTMEIPLPPLGEQKAIAHILGTLDEKIELNRKTNETLEAMATALFKSWFVDFDPVRAKAEGRPTGLPAEISDLFPDSFEDSELGEIPSRWAGDTFGSFTTAKRGRMITKKDTIEGIIPVVAGGMEPAYYHNQSNVDAPVVTISASGANAGFVNLYFQPIWASDCSYISQTESKFPLTCYLFLKLSQKKIYDAQHGGVQPHINPGDLSRLDFVSATENIFEIFEGIIRPIFAKVSSAIEESKQLENLRDALLPKLISGEIRIPDAEKMLEEVGV